ncbi:MAG: hypothetical protein ACI9NQ_001910 [Paracoccaceae bacterium]|jgi:hypothetical protein
MFTKTDFYFLGAAVVSLLASVALWFLYDKEAGLFVGIWVPSILAFWVGVKVSLLAHIIGRGGSSRK